MKPAYLPLIFSFLFCNLLYGQGASKSAVTYGFKLAALYSQYSNIPESIRGRDNTFDNSVMKSQGSFGFEGGFFLNCKLPGTRMALQPEILFRQSGERISYHDIAGKEFKLGLHYSYLQLGTFYKVYPSDHLNLGIGAFYDINLSPHEITYSSNEADGMYDVTIRQFYQDGLKGQDDFSLCFALGYELVRKIHFDVRYYLGVKDMIRSTASSFMFIENQNRSNTLCLSVGYILGEQ